MHKSFLKSTFCVIVLTTGVAGAAESPLHQAATGTSENADNSFVNKRDQSAKEVTADQQTSNTSDTEITRLIRQAVVKDDSLSIYAHNIKIITQGGVVTLKGPVRSKAEKDKAATIAKSVAGVSQVENQLSVKR
jgi:hyperosmotically inducible protein